MLRVWLLALAWTVVGALAASTPSYVAPSQNGGGMLTQQKEPLNVIISGDSDPAVLSPTGFSAYAQSFGFQPDTFAGQSSNDGNQSANLGDGRGMQPQAGLCRQNGLTEVLQGGNHFRYWFQTGPKANTSAVFLAVSVEAPLNQSHTVVPNGYDLGRDQFVQNATSSARTFQSTTYRTTLVQYNSSLLSGASKSSLNHNIGIDGRVAILKVDTSAASASASGNAQSGALGVEASAALALAVLVGAAALLV